MIFFTTFGQSENLLRTLKTAKNNNPAELVIPSIIYSRADFKNKRFPAKFLYSKGLN